RRSSDLPLIPYQGKAYCPFWPENKKSLTDLKVCFGSGLVIERRVSENGNWCRLGHLMPGNCTIWKKIRRKPQILPKIITKLCLSFRRLILNGPQQTASLISQNWKRWSPSR